MDRSSPAGESTSRRAVLGRGGAALAAVVGLSGCTGDVGDELPSNEHWPTAELVPDVPVRKRSDVLTEAIEALSTADIGDVEAFVTALEERDLEFETVEEVADQLSVEYVERDPTRHGTFEVTGLVAGAYTALVESGFEARTLELVFFEADDSALGVAEVDTEWAVGYNEGALSTDEFGELVAGTVESVRTAPEPGVEPEV
jgi:hypothetical protein